MPLDQPEWDRPMSLGDHLEDLRKAIIKPIIVLVVATIVAFFFQVELKEIMVDPLRRAMELAGPETVKKVGFPKDGPLLYTMELGESATTAIKISLLTAIIVTIPVLLWGLWNFVARGLLASERRAAFLFIPAGVILFYAGCVAGYFYGLPYFYMFLIQFQANDTTALFQLRQSEYVDTFLIWTVAMGLIWDIPWAVVILDRTGLIRASTLARSRRYVVLANLVLAACLTPTTDVFSLLLMFIPMQFFFEVGLIAARLINPRRPQPAMIDHE